VHEPRTQYSFACMCGVVTITVHDHTFCHVKSDDCDPVSIRNCVVLP